MATFLRKCGNAAKNEIRRSSGMVLDVDMAARVGVRG